MFNPNRLILAQKRRRLTARTLAEKAGLSPVTITRLKESNNPEPSTVSALSKALSFPIDFFFGDDIDIPTKDSVSFRSLSAMTAREREAALAAGSLAYLVSDWVTSRFNLPEIDLLDFSHTREPDSSARTLRQHWGLGEKPISNVIKLLESKGIRVFALSENTKNVDAFSCWRDNIPYIFLNTFKTAERSRYDALHELGHLVLHRHGGGQGREVENEANKFASYFLMPSADVISHIPRVNSLDQLVQAKKRWGVSVAALAYRLHKMGLISDWHYRTFCIQINKRFGKSEPNGLDAERSVVWEKVFRELWNDGITKEKVAKELAIPIDELESLVFGLLGSYKTQDDIKKSRSKTDLRLA